MERQFDHFPFVLVDTRTLAKVGEPKRFGMDGALARVGLTLEGTHHRGIDDALIRAF